ncbi:MAG: hypothetical protein SOZ62_04200 [Eubacteriales bacterium]|nr:hypothetical protein [Eubacteriales bacterium]
MKKRLLSLLFVALTIALCFALASCSDSEDESQVDTSSRTPVSLNFYIITDSYTTEAGVKDMQEKFNEWTESNFSTHVEFTMVTADQYETVLTDKIASVASAPSQTVSQKTEYYVDDSGMTRIKYPDITSDQLDIVLITSREMLLNQYMNLQPMDQLIRDKYPSLEAYYNNNVIKLSKLNNAIYAIPNNNVYGEYTYMIINKEIADAVYNSQPAETLDLSKKDNGTLYDGTTASNANNIYYDYDSFSKLLGKITDYNAAQTALDPSFKPIAPLKEYFEYPSLVYYSESGSKSAVAHDTRTPGVQFLFNNESYKNYAKFITEAKAIGYYDESVNSKYAMEIVTGDYSLRYKYSNNDYIVKVLSAPSVTIDDVCSSMFAVTKYTKNFDRSMEIINALSTNKELHNILLYGKPGTHYEITSSEVVSLLPGYDGSKYRMDIKYTGNYFLTYECPDIGLRSDVYNTGKDFIEFGKAQNTELVVSYSKNWYDILLKYESHSIRIPGYNGYDSSKNEDLSPYPKLSDLITYANNTLLADFHDRINAATTPSEIDTIFNEYAVILNNNSRILYGFSGNVKSFLDAYSPV